MPAKYLLDTNIYIQCMLDRDFALQYAEQYSQRLPSYEDWKKAGLTAVKIVLRRPDLKSKKIALLNDILIALSCHRIGATLITFNAQDFEVIRDFIQFRFQGF